MIDAMSRRLHTRSLGVLTKLENDAPSLMRWWLLVICAACALRILASPMSKLEPLSFVPYLLLIGAPLASFWLGLRWFRNGESMPQPTFRLSAVGRWRDLSLSEAKANPLFGTSGIMVSLLVGMLLNVPVRAAEYLVIMPAIPREVPGWLSTLHLAMTLDVVVLSSLYVVAFTMALRRVPSFPRFLLLVWLVDITAQVLIAQSVEGDLPAGVAGALSGLLQGNIMKVLISMGLWLPYLILSTRVNVTFRRRQPA
jgi:hypothetical protein